MYDATARVMAVFLGLSMMGSLLTGCRSANNMPGTAEKGSEAVVGVSEESGSSGAEDSAADADSETADGAGDETSAAEKTYIISDYISDGEDVGPDVYTAPDRTVIPFSQMSTDLYDADAADAALDQLETLCLQPHTLKQIKENYDIVVDQYDRLSTDYAVTEICYDRNYEDDELADRQTQIQLESAELGDRVLTTLGEVLESPYGDAMEAYINSDALVNDASDYTEKEDAEYDLLEEESSLIQEYYDLSSDGDEDGCAELYLKLLDNRIEQMKYDEKGRDYAEYSYEDVYLRDYYPEDSEQLYTWARETVVPWVSELKLVLSLKKIGLLAYYRESLTQDEILERLEPWLTGVSDTAEEAFRTMVENGLIDVEKSDTKVDEGFTTNLPYYGASFIFSDPSGDAGDIETVIHEFGHYYEAYSNREPEAYVYDCYDICEIDSQGLEALMFAHADEIYGEKAGDTAVLYNLYSLLTSITEGCLFDEFQQKALAARMDGTLQTADDLTALYKQVEDSYYGSTGLGWGDEWYQVSHTFDSPFYYISYATSAAAALSILSISERDYDQAMSMYNQLIDMGCDQGYRYTLGALGIPDPLTEQGQEQLTDSIGDYIDSLI